MKPPTQIVISASRRTDIPAFYMKWFMAQINQGSFEVINPYNRHVSIIPATPDKVHTIVFWSKNFGPFINGGFGERLTKMGFNLYFNFTVNMDSTLLEPRVPPLKRRIKQLGYLCEDFNASCINWRFDPICFYKNKNERIKNNLKDFSIIAKKASQMGIQRCTTSFMDDYRKIHRRIASIRGFSFIFSSLKKRKEIILEMEKELASKGIQLFVCCEKELLETLPSNSSITKSACIPNDLLVNIYGGNLSFKKDAGQRIKDGCGCMVSVDIGSYHRHPCFHNCLFCYANPVSGNGNSVETQ